MSEIHNRVGKNIERIIAEKHLIQKDVAEAAGISHTYFSTIIHGRKAASAKVLSAIAEALGVDFSELSKPIGYPDRTQNLEIPPNQIGRENHIILDRLIDMSGENLRLKDKVKELMEEVEKIKALNDECRQKLSKLTS